MEGRSGELILASQASRKQFNNNSSLLKLPAELRHEIYLYAFGGPHFRLEALDRRQGDGHRLYGVVCTDHPDQWGWDHGSNTPMRGVKEWHSNIGILLACRHMSAEALHLLYARSAFHIDDNQNTHSFIVFVTKTSKPSLAFMTSLTLTFTFRRNDSVPSNWTFPLSHGVLGKMHGLKKIEITIWVSHVKANKRYTECIADYKQSAVLLNLNRGVVSFTGVKSITKSRQKTTGNLLPYELAVEIARLIKGDGKI